MIDIQKVRLWSVRFFIEPPFASLPYPGSIVEEVEEKGYHMPLVHPRHIPPKVGGQLTLTLEGRGMLQVGKKRFVCDPGTAFLYRDCDPNVSYFMPNNSSRKWRFLWINFQGEAAERIICDVNNFYGYFFNLPETSPLKRRLMQFQDYANATFVLQPLEGAAFCFELLWMLCGAAKKQCTLSGNSKIALNVQKEISQAVFEPCSTSIIAGKIGVSREHMSKSFRMATGQTLQSYRTQQKLETALDLLLKSNCSCKEIAMYCNFGAYTSFFRAFRKAYHVSPAIFRKSLQSGKNPGTDS